MAGKAATKKKQPKQMEPQNDSFMQEVADDLRQEQLANIWKKYGKYIIGLAALVVLATGASVMMENYQNRKNNQSAMLFLSAAELFDENQSEQAMQKLDQVIADGTQSYVALAMLRKAGEQLDTGDTPAAIATYQQLANSSAPIMYREYGALQAAAHQMDQENADMNQIVQTLNPLTTSGKPWRHAAMELLAVAYIKQNNNDQAAQIIQNLLNDNQTPAGIRERATIMQSRLNA